MRGADPAAGALSLAPPPPPALRFWEVDLARTVAILMMVTYHAGYDVAALAPALGVDPFGGGWRALQVATGSTFLGLVGVGVAISDGRMRARGVRAAARCRRPLRRAAQVLGAAGLVSAGTYLALGDEWVRFGILHLIGVAMLTAPLFAALGAVNLPLGATLIAAGFAIRDTTVGGPAALVIGFRPSGEAGVDLYPLLPWFGVVLVGLAIGGILYPQGRRGPVLSWLPDSLPRRLGRLGAPGRHSLPIYLVHQPVLIPLVALALLAAGVEPTDGFE